MSFSWPIRVAIISNSYSDDNTSTVLSPVNTICPGENTVDMLVVVGGVEEIVDVNTICPGDNGCDYSYTYWPRKGHSTGSV